MSLRFEIVGAGAAFSPPNTSLLARGARTLLCDCGYGVPETFWRLSRDPDLLDGVWISHIHADHSFGLPALLLWMRMAGRTRPLQVLGGPGTGPWLTKLLELGYPGSYAPDKCYAIEAVEIGEGATWAWGPWTLRTARSDHSVRNLSLRIEHEGRALCYSGDGDVSTASQALYAGADVVVHECYTADEPLGGHAAARGIIRMAEDASVRELVLIHIKPEDRAAVVRMVEGYDGPVRLRMARHGDVLGA